MKDAQTTETSLRVSRVIKAPRRQVYRAWLDAQSPEMSRFAPDQVPGKPMRVEVHELEPRVGGRYRASMIAEEGSFQGTYTAHGEYLELVPDERIVQTHFWESEEESPQGTRVTIMFRDVEGGTEVTIVHEGLSGRESVQSHAEGWTQALENLAAAYEASQGSARGSGRA